MKAVLDLSGLGEELLGALNCVSGEFTFLLARTQEYQMAEIWTLTSVP